MLQRDRDRRPKGTPIGGLLDFDGLTFHELRHEGTSRFFEVGAPSESVSVSSVGQVEITLATGHRLRLSGAFDVDVVLHLARGLAGP